MDLECVLTFCINASKHVNNENNFDLNWDMQDKIRLGQKLTYPCKESMKIENNTVEKYEADFSIEVLCGEDGYFEYPDPWPMCSEDISCGDPPSAPQLGHRIWTEGVNGSTSYNTEVFYT